MSSPGTQSVEEFVQMLRDEPWLMPPAPPDWTGADISRRAASGQHSCLRCGHGARCAYIDPAKEHGARWLDLCPPCARWLRIGLDDLAKFDEWSPE